MLNDTEAVGDVRSVRQRRVCRRVGARAMEIRKRCRLIDENPAGEIELSMPALPVRKCPAIVTASTGKMTVGPTGKMRVLHRSASLCFQA